ncbi:BatA domain-containing protein [Persicitalea jodogahamensis]|uniref:Aerotolerance regulator N-terminal domain-containing protein n=1 Tax=Persicitalea jodogahamensis TaxID=402147 RepID=A0A8J3D3P1_9BACT|nr:BatA domain-containing protein [Persicitalea jodogahamensis]GHB77355.1 hypothetical protein GCM10007390_34290 [Persicitalea jodogahamensis]
MSFLFPSFLWGLLAVSVPIAIHFFNFRRTKRVFFTNVAFLKAVETQTSSFRKVKHWLILAARVLAVTCLVLAFAQPFLPSKSELGISRQGITSLYLDNSYSMQNEENNKRYLDIATGRLGDLLSVFRNATTLQLMTNDFSAPEQTLATADKIRDRLTTVGLSHTPRTLTEVYRRQQNLMARHATAGENQLFWFSDFQKSTVGDLSKIEVDSTNRLFIVPVQATPEKNIYVDSVWLNTPFIRELQNNILYVKVSNSGTEVAENTVVKLYLDDAQVSTASVDVPANGSANASFNFSIKGRGYKKGRITFDDFPVTFDNDYYFVLNASPVINIVHVYGQPTGGRYIENVFDNDSLFSTQSFSVQNVDVGQLRSADLVVLEGVEQPSGSIRTALEDFVKKGGSLAIIPPTSPDAGSYSSFLANLRINGLQPRQGAPQPVPMNLPDRGTPFFSDVFEESVRQETNLSLPSASPTWQWTNSGNTLLTLRNGQTYLSQTSVGQGKLYLFAAPLSAAYGNVAQHALFVPVMYKLASLSVRAQRTAYSFDENSLAMTVSDPKPNAVYKLRRGKTELIPVQRLNGNQLVLELPKSNQLSDDQSVDAGYYELMNEDNTEQLLALNHDNSESKLEYYTPDELRAAFSGNKNVEVFDKIDDAAFAREFEDQNLGTSLWKYFLIAALVFLLMEILLIRFLK